MTASVFRDYYVQNPASHPRQQKDTGIRLIIRILSDSFPRRKSLQDFLPGDAPFEHPAHRVSAEDNAVAYHHQKSSLVLPYCNRTEVHRRWERVAQIFGVR